jgi:hypothetical protein
LTKRVGLVNSKREVIEQYRALVPWVLSLQTMEDSLWLEPIAEGKWSTGEIIAHLTVWDRFVLEKRLPYMKPGAELTFGKEDVQAINESAASYARFHASKATIIDEFANMREALLQHLNEIEENDFLAEFRINEKPRTLSRYIQGLIEHDEHHRKQIEDFLQSRR